MPRQPRFVIAGQPHHVMQRGNNKQNIFNAHKDFLYYLNKLNEVSSEYECDIHAYVLMTNHTHLLITPSTQEALSKMMLKLGTCYASYFNHNYERTGALWEGRYKSFTIFNELYLFTCMRYIELNPVRANMVGDPMDYQWSSYSTNALGKRDLMITPHSLYLSLGNTEIERREYYKSLFNSPLSDNEIKKIQTSSIKSSPLF